MTEQFRTLYMIGVDTSQAQASLEALIGKVQSTDEALGVILSTIREYGTSLQSALNVGGLASGLQDLSTGISGIRASISEANRSLSTLQKHIADLAGLSVAPLSQSISALSSDMAKLAMEAGGLVAIESILVGLADKAMVTADMLASVSANLLALDRVAPMASVTGVDQLIAILQRAQTQGAALFDTMKQLETVRLAAVGESISTSVATPLARAAEQVSVLSSGLAQLMKEAGNLVAVEGSFTRLTDRTMATADMLDSVSVGLSALNEVVPMASIAGVDSLTSSLQRAQAQGAALSETLRQLGTIQLSAVGEAINASITIPLTRATEQISALSSGLASAVDQLVFTLQRVQAQYVSLSDAMRQLAAASEAVGASITAPLAQAAEQVSALSAGLSVAVAGPALDKVVAPTGLAGIDQLVSALQQAQVQAVALSDTLGQLETIRLTAVGEAINASITVPLARATEQAAALAKQIVVPTSTIGKSVEEMIRLMEQLQERLVGHSIIPDMVRSINRWFGRIGENVPEVVGRVQEEIAGLGTVPVQLQPLARQLASSLASDQVKQELERFIGGVAAGTAEAATWVKAASGEKPVLTTTMTKTGHEPVITQYMENGELVRTVTRMTEIVPVVDEQIRKAGTSVRDIETIFDKFGNQIKQNITQVIEFEDGTKRVIKSVSDMGNAVENAGESAQKSGRFFRHLTWILQGIVLWQAISAIQTFVSETISGFGQIEQAAARMSFITGQNISAVTDESIKAAAGLAKYGIGPVEAAGALLSQVKFGEQSEQVLDYAAQLSMVVEGQGDMADMTNSLLSVMRQWNISADESTRIMDALATAYATTPGSMKEFLALMKEGPGLAEQMGQSFEEHISMIARMMSYLPERTPSAVAGTLGRILTRIYQPDIARELAIRYGIRSYEGMTRRPGLEVLDQVAAAFENIRSEAERAALAELIAGTRGGQSWRDALVLLQNWSDGIRSTTEEMRRWSDLSGRILETQQTTGQAIRASFDDAAQAMFRATGLARVYHNILREINQRLQEAAVYYSGMEEQGFGDFWGKGLEWLKGALHDLFTGASLPALGSWLSGRNLTGIIREAQSRGVGIFAPRTSAPVATQESRMDDYWARHVRQQLVSATDYQAQRVKGSADEFSKAVKEAGEDFRLTTLQTMVATGWTPSPTIIDLTRSGEHEYTMSEIEMALRQSKVDTEKMIAAYRQALQEWGFSGSDLEVAMQNFTSKLIMQLQFFRLPGGEIRLMEGRDLLYYLSKIEENTRPLEGIWNVPEGMEVWVPIQSTFYGKWREKQKEGEEPGKVSLDAGQFDQAVGKFANAVDRMPEVVKGALGAAVIGAGTTLGEPAKLAIDFFRSVTDSVASFVGRLVGAIGGGWDYARWKEKEGQYPVPQLFPPPWSWWDYGQGRNEERPPWDYARWKEKEGQAPPPMPVQPPQETGKVPFVGAAAFLPFVEAAGKLAGAIGNLAGMFGQKQGGQAPVASIVQSALQPVSSILSTIASLKLSGLGMPSEVKVPPIKIPTPLEVTFSQRQISAGVQIGILSSGVPVAISAMTFAMSSQASLLTAILFVLRAIEVNTSKPVSVSVTLPPATGAPVPTVTSVGNYLMNQWYTTSGPYLVST